MQHTDKQIVSNNIQGFFFIVRYPQVVTCHLKFCIFVNFTIVLFWKSSQEVLYICLAYIHSEWTAFCCCKCLKDRRHMNYREQQHLDLILERIMQNILLLATWLQTQGEKYIITAYQKYLYILLLDSLYDVVCVNCFAEIMKVYFVTPKHNLWLMTVLNGCEFVLWC